MLIRTYENEKDLDAVLELWATAGDGIQLSRSDTPEEILKKLKRDPDLFLVAVENEKIVGVVLGGYDGRRGIIYHLAVRLANRGAGIGKLLMSELEERLKAKGCLKYYLLVTQGNPDVLSFYESIGCEKMPHQLMGKEIL